MSIFYAFTCYCSLCDKHFPTVEARANHLLRAYNHPKCDKCDLHFANRNALRNHYVVSRRHHYCSVCELEFKTAAGFRAHLELAAVHRDDSDDDDAPEYDGIDDSYEGWEDDVGMALFPEENDDYPEPPVSLDDAVPPEDEYWDEDDEPAPEEEDFTGWAPVPPEYAALRQASSAQDPEQATAPVSGQFSLPSSSPSSSVSGSCSDLGCTICLEAAVDPTSMRCGHIFCGTCIREALAVQMQCPVCRTRAKWQHMRRLSLGFDDHTAECDS